MFAWFRRRRRARVLARHAIPDAVWREVIASVPSLAALSRDERARLRDLAVLFLHEKHIEPALGLELTDAMRVRIAALACRLILELDLDCYSGFRSVIVYPGEFLVRDREHIDDAGVVHVGDEALSGEAWERGPVVLSWADVEQSGQGDGYDVVAHEFAHKLDAIDGATNGMPPLHRGMSPAAWSTAFSRAYDELCAEVDAGVDTWLDPYASENPAECFAVCVEMFFDVPDGFRREYPELYEQLAGYFRQDPR